MNWYDAHLYDYQMRPTGNEAMNQPKLMYKIQIENYTKSY